MFGSVISVSDPTVFTSFMRKSRQNLINVVIDLARAIKFQLGRVVCWRSRSVCDGVSIYDRCLNTVFDEDI